MPHLKFVFDAFKLQKVSINVKKKKTVMVGVIYFQLVGTEKRIDVCNSMLPTGL